MPKKSWGTNEKVEEARGKKAASKKDAQAKETKAKEDAYWQSHENPKGRKDVKREEEQKKKEEAAAKKAELKRLAAQEEAELANLGKKKAAPKPKVTSHQLSVMKEADKKDFEKAKQQQIDSTKRQVDEETYASLVEVENRNKDKDGAVDARSLDAALDQMSIIDGVGADRHPEKRAKAAFEEYMEEKLPELKEEKPGLRLMQYKSMIFDMWQRDPKNPRNQTPV